MMCQSLLEFHEIYAVLLWYFAKLPIQRMSSATPVKEGDTL